MHSHTRFLFSWTLRSVLLEKRPMLEKVAFCVSILTWPATAHFAIQYHTQAETRLKCVGEL